MVRIAAAMILALLLAACAGQKQPSLVLEGDVWMVQAPDTLVRTADECGMLTLEFRSNGQWSGGNCCSRAAGYYSLYEADEQHRISLSVEIVSRENCSHEQEDPFYFERLSLAESYRLEPGRLVLMDEAEEPVLEFRPASIIQK